MGLTLEDVEREARRQIEQNLFLEKALTDRMLLLSMRALELARGRRFKRQWLLTIVNLTIHAINSFRVAHEALMNGYPAQSVGLARSTFEDYLAAKWISYYPKDARLWWARKYGEYAGTLPGSRKRKPRKNSIKGRTQVPPVETLIKQASNNDVKSERALKLVYHYLSQFSHPRYTGLAVEKNDQPSQTYYYLGGEFRRDDALYAYNALMGVGVLVAQMAGGFAGSGDQDWMSELNRVNEAWITWKIAYESKLPKKRSAAHAISVSGGAASTDVQI